MLQCLEKIAIFQLMESIRTARQASLNKRQLKAMLVGVAQSKAAQMQGIAGKIW